jgi:large subunit ribosomal protein L15
VTPESLTEAHLLRDPRNPVVILGRGEMTVGLKVRAHRVSAGAKAKIEKGWRQCGTDRRIRVGI